MYLFRLLTTTTYDQTGGSVDVGAKPTRQTRGAIIAVILATCGSAQVFAAPIEEIVVTARKRVESLSAVPQTITAYSGEDLAARQIFTSGEIASQTPNLMWHSIFGFSSPQIFLRGIGNTTFNANQANPVGVHVDGVYQGSSLTYGFGLLDVERVEILKGPQGTLFGRNTTGGVVNFITRKPEIGENAGSLTATAGNFNQADVEAVANVAAGDKAALRFSALTLNRDGYVANRVPTSGTINQGKVRLWSGRVQGRVLAGDAFDILFEAHGGRLRSDVMPGKQIGVNCPPGLAHPGIGQCTDFFGFRDTPNLRESFTNIRAFDNVDTAGANASVTWHGPGFDVVSQTNYDANTRKLITDPDSAPLPEVKASVASRFHQVSQEVRALSTGDTRLNWIVGGTFYRHQLTAFQNFTLNAFGPGVLSRFFPVQEGVAARLVQGTTNKALFGEATYDFTPELSLTVGARWTDDRRTADSSAFLFNATGLAQVFVDETTANRRLLVRTIPPMMLAREWRKWSGRGILSYRIDGNALVYAGVARGFKGGDYNGGALFSPAEANIVDPEYVTSYEAGVKGTFADRRVSYSLAAFAYDFTNQQVSLVIPGSSGALQSLSNAGKSRVRGVEGELSVSATEPLFLQAKFGFLDAKFVRFQLDPANPATNYANNRLASSPRFSFNALAKYTMALGNGMNLSLSGDAAYKGAHYFTADNNPAMYQTGYWLLGADIALSLRDDRYTLKAWVKNAGDKKYAASGVATTGFGYMELVTGLPRTYGLTASAKF